MSKSYNDFVSSTIKKYGFPSYSLIGREPASAFLNIIATSIIHKNVQAEALSKMKIQVIKKEASAEDFARTIDMISYKDRGKQVYGSVINISCVNCKPQDKKFIILPIEDSMHVDIRRNEIGLGSMEEYVNKMKKMFKTVPLSSIQIQKNLQDNKH